MQRDLRNAKDRERRHKKIVKSLLRDLKQKNLLTKELQKEIDLYNGGLNFTASSFNRLNMCDTYNLNYMFYYSFRMQSHHCWEIFTETQQLMKFVLKLS